MIVIQILLALFLLSHATFFKYQLKSSYSGEWFNPPWNSVSFWELLKLKKKYKKNLRFKFRYI